MDHIARTPRQIGAIIQRERKLKNLTQSELAEMSGLRQEKISKIEAGAPSTKVDLICTILGALGLELSVAERTKGSPKDIEDIF